MTQTPNRFTVFIPPPHSDKEAYRDLAVVYQLTLCVHQNKSWHNNLNPKHIITADFLRHVLQSAFLSFEWQHIMLPRLHT
jgi:hypothetical protein